MHMKKTILFTLLALLGMTQAVAQDYEYVPLVREGVKWVYSYVRYQNSADPSLPHGVTKLNLELKGDTIIGGKTYKAMHKYFGDAINEENDTIPIYLREEDKVVYGIVPDGKIYGDCAICCGDNGYSSEIKNGEEFVMYDFNDLATLLRANSTLFILAEAFAEEDGDPNPLRFTDTITINDKKVKRYVYYCFGDLCFIEGIGFDSKVYGYLLAYLYPQSMSRDDDFFLSHVIEDGKVIYRSAVTYDSSAGLLRMARPDVKWINEHVTVSQGDTVCYYYTYEFEPTESIIWDDYYCYYSSVPDSPTDSVVSICRNDGWRFYGYNNSMLSPIIGNGNNLIDFYDHNLLYAFDKPDISSYYLRNYYIYHQNGSFLNRNNFIEVEPLEIEGVECSRYAYIDEQGNTVAYVVEGIGFDSRDMGDLLTPFTRRPDPTADYQEWCGLSHVVKDGQIIYKGMRYRHGAFEGIDETVADRTQRPADPNYYNLMGQPVGKDVPTSPGIYIHNSKKIVVR